MKLIQTSYSYLFKTSKRSGFTLIELLATLTIMAIIAAALIPFIGNYTQKAKDDTNLRSLKIFQDAMNRYIALAGSVPTGAAANSWGTPGATVNSRVLLSETEEANIIAALAAPGTNQTLQQPSPALDADNVEIMVEGTGSTANWFIIRYRANDTDTGISRNAVRLARTADVASSTITVTLNSNNSFVEGDGFDIGPAGGGAMVDAGAGNALP